jgi:hypothetical protein
MDETNCKALKAELAEQPQPQCTSIERFFDGNDDEGSIGCNLMEHPGMDVFSRVLTGLLRHPDVEAVYAQISELDPGEESWPFADTVFVIGTIPAKELEDLLRVLEPDEVGPADDVPDFIAKKHEAPVLLAWWD